jgi:endonuclease-3
MNLAETRAVQIMRILRRMYPDAACTLEHVDPWQLMVGAILAAQCTDARVNLITPGLFARFPDAAAMALAHQTEVEELVRSCGLFRNKARAIIGASQVIVERHQGMVPDQLDALLDLPGIGRKIANLILGDSFGIPAVVVDTHCARISKRLGLTDRDDPPGIEKDLMKVLPRADWADYGHLIVTHGRALCMARQPKCGDCALALLCRYASGTDDAFADSRAAHAKTDAGDG